MKSEYSVAELVPHSGKMSLLDNIVEYADDWLRAEVYITEASMFADEKGVPAWTGMEYMAQTIGAFAGMQERREGGEPKLGFLLGTRKYTCSVDYFPLGQTLILTAKREMQAENGLSVFQCSLHGEGIEASASLNVYQPEDADSFLKDAIS
ncbi:hotdog family protein [Marinobacterium arenosum]|uniref:hotdog family protein n=1 Tax=Marinobacterium arenosum TaxID=2862496 RepID=UPI001C96AA78|nr:hotdog family protein [Marinobacterium arenosum]MBY4676121.1 hotdog family protein [Marinobacterium arenosum]